MAKRKYTRVNNANETHLNDWVQQIRYHLIITEERNTRIRCHALITTINEETPRVTKEIFGENPPLKQFTFIINEDQMKEYLSCIYKWKGLTSSAQIPLNQNAYQKKAKNWLNGRRHKMYGESLFFDMIQSAIKFAHDISLTIPQNQQNVQQFYEKSLTYGYLNKMCKKRILLSKSVKHSYLISSHAITTGGKTKQLLQKYVTSHTYSKHFPSHRKEAVDYFQKESDNATTSLHAIIGRQIETEPILVSEETIDRMLKGLCPTVSGGNGEVLIKMDSFAKILGTINTLNSNRNALQDTISKLTDKIIVLELEYSISDQE